MEQGNEGDIYRKVWFDMQSTGGGEPKLVAANDICSIWNDGFSDLSSVHHQAGQYLIDVNLNEATIFAYAVAFHCKKSAKSGKIGTFAGSYDLKAIQTD